MNTENASAYSVDVLVAMRGHVSEKQQQQKCPKNLFKVSEKQPMHPEEDSCTTAILRYCHQSMQLY